MSCHKQKEFKIQKLQNGIRQFFIFSESQLKSFEIRVNRIVEQAKCGKFKKNTVDYTPLRNKYFFGERYTYGSQSIENDVGSEKLYPENSVDSIPSWITNELVKPLTDAEILPKNFFNSVVINVYQPGGCIVSHIDPPHIFDRPIVSLSLFSDSALCFGCKFYFKPLRCSKPLFKLNMPRGVVTSLSNYAANDITHCVRPEDVTRTRAVIMLRRVHPDAPRLPAVICNDYTNQYLNQLTLTNKEFTKLHQAVLKWQSGKKNGNAKKIIHNRMSYCRYTEQYYKIF